MVHATPKSQPKHCTNTYPNKEANTHIQQWEKAEGGEGLKLLGMWVSPFIQCVNVALCLKGLAYEYVEEDLKSKSELLHKPNPVNGKVPVLIHGGKPVYESCVIVQYIDEAFIGTGPALLPADPHDRVVTRFWATFVDDMLSKAMQKESRGKMEEEMADGMKQATDAVVTLVGALRECSKGKPFFGGDNAGYMDVVLGGLLTWMHAFEVMQGVKTFNPATTPLIATWVDRYGALDVVQQSTPNVGRLVDFAMARRGRTATGKAN